MKSIFYVVVCAFILSCSSAPKEKETENVQVVSSSPDTTVNLHPELDQTYGADDTEVVEKTETVSNSNDLDEAIDEYGKYMDDYIVFIKKGKAGDQTAMLDAMELMTKAEGVHKRLNEAKGELTAKQLAKFSKIQTKLLEASR